MPGRGLWRVRLQACNDAGCGPGRAREVALGQQPTLMGANGPAIGPAITLTGACTKITFTVQSSEALYVSTFLFKRSETGPTTSLGITNHDAGSTKVLNDLSAGDFILGIRVHDTGDVFWAGPGARNPDGLTHARTSGSTVSFEDWHGGGDEDFDDAVLRVDPGQLRREPSAAASRRTRRTRRRRTRRTRRRRTRRTRRRRTRRTRRRRTRRTRRRRTRRTRRRRTRRTRRRRTRRTRRRRTRRTRRRRTPHQRTRRTRRRRTPRRPHWRPRGLTHRAAPRVVRGRRHRGRRRRRDARLDRVRGAGARRGVRVERPAGPSTKWMDLRRLRHIGPRGPDGRAALPSRRRLVV